MAVSLCNTVQVVASDSLNQRFCANMWSHMFWLPGIFSDIQIKIIFQWPPRLSLPRFISVQSNLLISSLFYPNIQACPACSPVESHGHQCTAQKESFILSSNDSFVLCGWCGFHIMTWFVIREPIFHLEARLSHMVEWLAELRPTRHTAHQCNSRTAV